MSGLEYEYGRLITQYERCQDEMSYSMGAEDIGNRIHTSIHIMRVVEAGGH